MVLSWVVSDEHVKFLPIRYVTSWATPKTSYVDRIQNRGLVTVCCDRYLPFKLPLSRHLLLADEFISGACGSMQNSLSMCSITVQYLEYSKNMHAPNTLLLHPLLRYRTHLLLTPLSHLPQLTQWARARCQDSRQHVAYASVF